MSHKQHRNKPTSGNTKKEKGYRETLNERMPGKSITQDTKIFGEVTYSFAIRLASKFMPKYVFLCILLAIAAAVPWVVPLAFDGNSSEPEMVSVEYSKKVEEIELEVRELQGQIDTLQKQLDLILVDKKEKMVRDTYAPIISFDELLRKK